MFSIYAAVGKDGLTEMQPKYQHSPNHFVFVTPPQLDGTGPNLTVANYLVRTQRFGVWNEYHQAFTPVVRLGQISIPHPWLFNTESSGYGNGVSDLQQLSGVAQMSIFRGEMGRPNIMTVMI